MRFPFSLFQYNKKKILFFVSFFWSHWALQNYVSKWRYILFITFDFHPALEYKISEYLHIKTTHQYKENCLKPCLTILINNKIKGVQVFLSHPVYLNGHRYLPSCKHYYFSVNASLSQNKEERKGDFFCQSYNRSLWVMYISCLFKLNLSLVFPFQS